MRLFSKLAIPAALFFALIGAQAQQAWKARTDLPGVDFSAMTPDQRSAALQMLREMGCTCGCDMRLAQCRVEDPNCGYSTALAKIIVTGFREGKSPEEVAKLVAASPFGKPRTPPKILEDAVKIPTAGAPSRGPASARITLVEFSDFECPYCAKAAVEIEKIQAAYPNQIRLVFKQFPLSMHPHAELAAQASLAAAAQDKFWPLHDKMFSNHRELTREHLLAWAAELGLDIPKFTAALDAPATKATVRKDYDDGEAAGVDGTPALYINGKHFNGPVALSYLKPYLDEELKPARAAAKR